VNGVRDRESAYAQEKLSTVVPADTAAAIIAVSQTAPADAPEPVMTPEIDSKDARSAFHALIRSHFGAQLMMARDASSARL
jgi:hypothetical protein